VESINLERKIVTVSHGFDHHHHDIPYDQVVIGLGSITNFFNLPGLEQRAMTMKSLGDAIHLRNRLIAHLEEADTECCADIRRPLLTFVVAGGGFAGVETIASINDFVCEAIGFYSNLREDMLRVVLVHPGTVILPELGEKLGRYTEKKLSQRGVEILVNTRVTGVTEYGVQLSTGQEIESKALIWTAGTSPNPVLDCLPCVKERGRLKADEMLRLPDWPGVWVLGDCALVPDRKTGQYHPPTAQHALREAKTLAKNLIATVRGGALRPFSFSTIGQLAAIGRRTGVANILGINFSGFMAWWMWRTIYLSKLPRFEKKLRVALDWTLDLLFSKDLVQFQTFRAPTVSHMDDADTMAGSRASRAAAASMVALS
jgi:NADH dehydrogenase